MKWACSTLVWSPLINCTACTQIYHAIPSLLNSCECLLSGGLECLARDLHRVANKACQKHKSLPRVQDEWIFFRLSCTYSWREVWAVCYTFRQPNQYSDGLSFPSSGSELAKAIWVHAIDFDQPRRAKWCRRSNHVPALLGIFRPNNFFAILSLLFFSSSLRELLWNVEKMSQLCQTLQNLTIRNWNVHARDITYWYRGRGRFWQS